MIAKSQLILMMIIHLNLRHLHRRIPPQVPLGRHRQLASTDLPASRQLPSQSESKNIPSHRYMPCKRLRLKPARVRIHCTFNRNRMMYTYLCIYYSIYPFRCTQFLYINDILEANPNTNQLSMLNRTSHLLLIHRVRHMYYTMFPKRNKGNFEGIKCRYCLECSFSTRWGKFGRSSSRQARDMFHCDMFHTFR